MPDAKARSHDGLPGTDLGPAQPLADDPGTAPEPNTVPRPDLGDDTDGDVPPDERQKLPMSGEEGFGEPVQD